MLCSKTIPPPTHSMDKANNVLIANPMQICAPTLRTKIDYKSRSCDSRQSKFDKTLNQIPDLNKANYAFFLARARGEWGFSVAKMWPAFYVTLEKQSVETWDLFWDAFRREIASRTHDIKQSIGILLTRSRCSSLFPTFQKKWDQRDLCVRIKSQVFF